MSYIYKNMHLSDEYIEKNDEGLRWFRQVMASKKSSNKIKNSVYTRKILLLTHFVLFYLLLHIYYI